MCVFANHKASIAGKLCVLNVYMLESIIVCGIYLSHLWRIADQAAIVYARMFFSIRVRMLLLCAVYARIANHKASVVRKLCVFNMVML